MKLAILGSSPLALEAALRFHLHGASLTWFNFDEVETESYFPNAVKGDSYVSEAGLAALSEMGKSYDTKKAFHFETWKQDYFLPLTQYLSSDQRIRPHDVVSVAKRYLAPEETPTGKTRFLDLFRIIYQINPKDFIKEQEAQNPETFERLTKEFVDSLQSNLEMYEDFDLVLDLRRSTSPQSLSIAGRALGESRIPKDHIKYGLEALKMAQEINADAQDVREIALIGSGDLSTEIVNNLADWMKDQRSRLFVVSDEAWPFQKYLDENSTESAKKLKDIFAFMENEFEKDINTFHQKLREWQELDDFVQVKMQKPVEPIPRLVFFSGHNASAVDQLIDKRRLFLTLEKPELREGLRHPENNSLELKTIGVDRILVANKLNKPKIDIHFGKSEIGFYQIDQSLPNLSEAWSKDLKSLKGIENEIFKLFSPAHAH